MCLFQWVFTRTIVWTFLKAAGHELNALPDRFATARRYYLSLVHLAVRQVAGLLCVLYAPSERRGEMVNVWSVLEIQLRSRQVW